MKVGDYYPWWGAPRLVLKVSPYTGAYPNFFNCVLRLATSTPRGWTETVHWSRNPIFSDVDANQPKPLWEPDSHWDNHPEHRVEGWQNEVANGDTRQSYVEWVNSQIESACEQKELEI